MTASLLAGIMLGELILRLGVAEKLMKKLLPLLRRFGVGPVLGLALAVSIGSSKAGAALLAAPSVTPTELNSPYTVTDQMLVDIAITSLQMETGSAMVCFGETPLPTQPGVGSLAASGGNLTNQEKEHFGGL